MNAFVRLAAEELHPMEVAFFHNLFALAFMLPWAALCMASASLVVKSLSRIERASTIVFYMNLLLPSHKLGFASGSRLS
jgi:hypothetical protein